MPSPSIPANELTPALTATLRTALATFPELVRDLDLLAARLAAALAVPLSQAVEAAGTGAGRLAEALNSGARNTAAPSAEHRVLAALTRHPSGRSPGMTPESLATLTGMSSSALGPAVSALVQAGALVRDAWLVRLPHPDDLLPNQATSRDRGSDQRQLTERRSIGDRRAVGERRLYDRRALHQH
jgi:hypothetical protein